MPQFNFHDGGISNQQLDLIEGSLLGDGCLKRFRKHPTWNWQFTKKQSKFDIEGIDKSSYIEFHSKILNSFIKGNISVYKEKSKIIHKNSTTTPETKGYCYCTRSHQIFTELGKKWYVIDEQNNAIKIVPDDLQLNPLSLCVWYMDDGTKEKGANRCRIATNGFTHTEVNKLTQILNAKYNFNSRLITNTTNQPMIEIGGFINYQKLYEVISPQINWNCFNYKLESPKQIVFLCGEDHPKSKLGGSDINDIYQFYLEGKSQTELANQFNVKPNTINTILRGNSWKSIKRVVKTFGNKGERNSRAKLTLQEVLKIRSEKGIKSYSSLAKEYNVSKSLISSIMNNRCWI